MKVRPPTTPRPNGPDWVRDAVFYQIFPDRFARSRRVPKLGIVEPWDAPPTTYGFKGGDLLGIAEHLDELRGLGITALYLTPVFASASNHRYHTFDYERVDPLLGGDAALRELLDAAHARNMRVILDGVFNHASRGFWPFHHVLENGANSPYRDWFYLDPQVQAGKRGLNAYPGVHGAAERDFGYQAWWDMPALPKLNHSNPAVREYIYGVAERWLRFGIDGWRLDVPEEIGEPGFWEEFRRRCLAVKPDAYLVGEIWNPAPEWLTGGRFHALMNYPLAEAILSFVGAGRLDEALVSKTHEYARHVRPIDGPEFGRQLTSVMATYAPEVASLQLNLLDSHDTPRFISLAGGDATALRLATLIQMTLPGVPCVYYGDEMGVEGREDPDCRRAYPWDPAGQDRAMRDFFSGLIALRHTESVVRHGRLELLGAVDSSVAYGLFGTEDLDRSIIVAINAGDQPARLELELPDLTGLPVAQVTWPGDRWGTRFAPRKVKAGALTIEIEAREGLILGVGASR
jgi:cyclomaltodextrinase / maltogenic alpha-amylase / neopullulanase